MAEPAPRQAAYSDGNDMNGNSTETPLEVAARTETPDNSVGTQTRREEQEADRLVADIDAYVAQTDPASLPEAEAALNAWEIPSSPLEGIPDDVVLEPDAESEPLVPIFAAHSQSEASIVHGLLEASGIPAVISSRSGPALGGIFQPDETRWGDILVSAPLAEAARALIDETTRSAAADSSELSSAEV